MSHILVLEGVIGFYFLEVLFIHFHMKIDKFCALKSVVKFLLRISFFSFRNRQALLPYLLPVYF